MNKEEEEWARQDILNLPEWYQPMYNGYGSCPWCENFQHEGHHPECRRKIVKEIIEAAFLHD